MIFNSIQYFYFLPLVVIIYWLLKRREQNRFLLLASYFFYGCWDIRFLFLIVLSTSVDYLIGLLIERGKVSVKQYGKSTAWLFFCGIAFLVIHWEIGNGLILVSFRGLHTVLGVLSAWFTISYVINRVRCSNARLDKRKLYLGISVVVNLSILGVFKYYNFFIESAELLLTSIGADTSLLNLDIILPVGISFYTFQTISYSIDIFRKEVKPTDSFIAFALFVSFFPQLVAGPIERAKTLLPRIAGTRVFSKAQFERGIFLIALGLFKKVAIADAIAPSVNSVYNSTGAVTWLDILLATFLFSIQIYCDFSGYSDIARGTSKLLGIDLMRNFNLPYFSTNPGEFWKRWHISLSSWLRDYLYIPLGGGRKSKWFTNRNLIITMLLGGLWHGAAFNFILWGAYQGTILCLYRAFSAGKNTASAGRFLLVKMAVFFVLTCYGWLLFRCNSLAQVLEFTRVLFVEFGDISTYMKRPTFGAVLAIPLLVAFEITEYRTGDDRFYLRVYKPLLGIIAAYVAFLFLMGVSSEPVQFIYFQF